MAACRAPRACAGAMHHGGGGGGPPSPSASLGAPAPLPSGGGSADDLTALPPPGAAAGQPLWLMPFHTDAQDPRLHGAPVPLASAAVRGVEQAAVLAAARGTAVPAAAAASSSSSPSAAQAAAAAAAAASQLGGAADETAAAAVLLQAPGGVAGPAGVAGLGFDPARAPLSTILEVMSNSSTSPDRSSYPNSQAGSAAGSVPRRATDSGASSSSSSTMASISLGLATTVAGVQGAQQRRPLGPGVSAPSQVCARLCPSSRL